MAFYPPLMCPWRCHEIGGPWISYNPNCPFHGSDPVDLEELDEDEGERMCREQQLRREEEARRWAEEEARWAEGDEDE